MSDSNTHEMATVRLLASTSKTEMLERCLQDQIEQGFNNCYDHCDYEQVFNVLTKANFVKKLEAKGLSIPGAIRELARRMRFAQGKSS